MDNNNKIPFDTSPEEIKVRIKQAYSNDKIRDIHQVTLKEGPRTYKFATIIEIIDPKTGGTHHFNLRLDSIDRTKLRGWVSRPDNSISLTSEDVNEIARLRDFLITELEGKLKSDSKELHIVRGEEFTKLQNLLNELPQLESFDQIQLVKTILHNISSKKINASELAVIFDDSNHELVKTIGIVATLVDYRQEYNRLIRMINENENSEHKFQKLLESNSWMFGSEYSELLERRNWTRDENVDFMLRRTADDYLEIIEIKVPSIEKLLVYDESHHSYYNSAILSKVIGQVTNYIEEIERNRDSIITKDNCDTLKIRAKIIIGRDGNKQQQEALRNLNSHLYRIEIITFDQLAKIANRVISLLSTIKPPALPVVEHRLCK